MNPLRTFAARLGARRLSLLGSAVALLIVVLVGLALGGADGAHSAHATTAAPAASTATTPRVVTLPNPLDQRQVALQARLRQQIETMLEQVVGRGRVRADVAADISFEQVREEAELYDPDMSVARTTHDSGASEEITYDNSRRTTTRISPGGEIERLSVSVMVDGSYRRDSAGRKVYVPRTADEIALLTRLVENAIGFDDTRGDIVVVENVRFAEPVDAAGKAIDLGSADLQAILKTLVLGLVALVALVVIVRPLLRRGEQPLPAVASAARPLAAMPEQDLDVAHVEGRLKAATLQRVGDVVQRNPGESVAIVRQWMQS